MWYEFFLSSGSALEQRSHSWPTHSNTRPFRVGISEMFQRVASCSLGLWGYPKTILPSWDLYTSGKGRREGGTLLQPRKRTATHPGGLLACLLVNSLPSLCAERYLSWNHKSVARSLTDKVVTRFHAKLTKPYSGGVPFLWWLVSWRWVMPSFLNLSDFTPNSSTKSQLLSRPSCQERIKAGFLGIWSPDALRRCGSGRQLLAGSRTTWLLGRSVAARWKHDQKHRE